MVIFGCINLYFNSQIFKGFIYDLCIFISSLRRPSLRNSTLLYILKFEICFSHLCLNSSELIFKSATRWKSNFLFFSMDNQTVPHHLQRQHKCSEYINISSVNNDIFISSLTNCIPFISFSCLSALAYISKLMLKRHSEKGHYWLVPDLSVKTPISPLLSMILYILF